METTNKDYWKQQQQNKNDLKQQQQNKNDYIGFLGVFLCSVTTK